MSDSLISFACDLVRTPSVLGTEGAMAERVVAEMRLLGFDHVQIDDIGNVVGVVEGGSVGPTVLLDAHMDTVDVMPHDAWMRDPFGGEIDEGQIWGRGASDMKGALAAMVHAVGGLDRMALAGRAVVVGSVEEERIEGAALRPVCERHGPDLVIIGEATDLDLVHAGRGRAEFVVEVAGESAHASTPDQGVHAVHRMIPVIREMETLPRVIHPTVGMGVMCLTDIVSEPYPAQSVVPSACRVTYERRLVLGETEEGVLAELAGACERAGASDAEVSLARARLKTWTGHEIDERKWLPPWRTFEDDPLVLNALEALASAGIEAELGVYGFCTNAAYTAGMAGIPTIGFGPGREDLAHIADESLEIEQLLASSLGYRALVSSFLAL